jgi:hypothetical protein
LSLNHFTTPLAISAASLRKVNILVPNNDRFNFYLSMSISPIRNLSDPLAGHRTANIAHNKKSG